jgi:hypothetical protein
MAKAIGPNFANELAAYGAVHSIELIGAPFAWGADGALSIDDPRLTDAQKAAIQAVYAAHDPSKVDPTVEAGKLLTAGLTITCDSVPALGGVYGTSPSDEVTLTGLQVSVVANVFPGFLRDKAGTKHTMTGTQFQAIATAALAFIVAVEEAAAAALAGTAAWTPPATTVSISG